MIPPAQRGGGLRSVLRRGCQWRVKCIKRNAVVEAIPVSVQDRDGATLEIVKRTDKEGGFKHIRRRWVIERTFSWIGRNLRLMAHYEAIAIITEGFAKLAMISVMLKTPDRANAKARNINF